ncbi:HNH endonuclease [Comamonas sediminis]|uniref:HNH endonuclease n=1 Tax=Comamonas sediminis TaxID=1783360 RepID=UPI003D2DE07E
MKTLRGNLPVLMAALKVLDAKQGATQRIGGNRWMKFRESTLTAGAYTCVGCSRVHASNEVDHDTPLEQGGSNDQSNLVVRCTDCQDEARGAGAVHRVGWIGCSSLEGCCQSLETSTGTPGAKSSQGPCPGNRPVPYAQIISPLRIC